MRSLPIVIKLLINLFFFSIYSIVSIFLGSFIYGLTLDKILGQPVPGSSDPVHIKIAIVSLSLSLLITIILRKYFYIKLNSSEISDNSTKQNKQDLEKLDKIIEKDFAKLNSKKNKNDFKVMDENTDDIKIYFGKEIK